MTALALVSYLADNWTFLEPLVLSINHCAKCHTADLCRAERADQLKRHFIDLEALHAHARLEV